LRILPTRTTCHRALYCYGPSIVKLLTPLAFKVMQVSWQWARVYPRPIETG